MTTKEKLEYLNKIIEVYEKSGVTFFEFSDDTLSITLDKTVMEVEREVMAPVKQAVEERVESKCEEKTPCKAEVVSPIVGTFYSAPSPDKPNYVNEGDKVKKGQVLCIVEAMKLMNEIVAPCDGTVEEILVENEDGVEYNQVLIRIV